MLDWGPWVKGFVTITALCGQMSAPTPVAAQGVPLGLGSNGGCCFRLWVCVQWSLLPPNYLCRTCKKVNCLWSIFHWVTSDSSQVKGGRDEGTWVQTHLGAGTWVWLQEWCFFPVCVTFLTAKSCIFMCNRFCWWWQCLVRIINLIINPHVSEGSCKSRGWNPNVSEYHLCYRSL